MRHGFLSPLAAAALTFALSQPSFAAPSLGIATVYAKIQGWTIGPTSASDGCVGATTYRDGTTVWIGFDSTGQGFLAFSSANWPSIAAGKQYHIELRAGGSNWYGTFMGVERRDEKAIVAQNIKLDFLTAFARSGGFGVYIDGATVARLSLSGSNSALGVVSACQKQFSANGSRTPTEKASMPRTGRESDQSGGSSGTGFFVSEKGHVLTNNHVVEGCSRFTVTPPGETPRVANVIAHDAVNDLAILASELRPTVFPSFNTKPKVGENIHVYGFPLSGVLATSGNFTVGNITATAGLNDDTRMIQISAPVQPGNSGGPVMDQTGNIAGVLVSKLNALRIAKVTDDIPQNVNFAIKSSIATNFLESNGITPSTKLADMRMEPTAIAELARTFTLRINCK
jgi:serine protease Do